MSPGGRSERIGFLREAVARIEAGGSSLENNALQDAEAIAAARTRRRAAFFEIAPATMADGPAAAGFALMAATRLGAGEGGPLLWIAEEFALLESGVPHSPGLAFHGVPWGDFVLMRMARRADVFFALEEAIRARAFAAIVCEPAGLADADAKAVARRLAPAARASGARAILLRPPAGPRAPFFAPTPMRFEVAARPAPRPAAGRRPLPGLPAWRVRWTGPPGSVPGLEPDSIHDVDLSGEDFLSAALSFRLPVRMDGAGADTRAA
jgi:protein ImuA